MMSEAEDDRPAGSVRPEQVFSKAERTLEHVEKQAHKVFRR